MNPAANGICCLTNTLSGRLYTTISDAGIDGFFFWTGVQVCGESQTQKMRISTPHNRSHLQRELPFRSASFPKTHWRKQQSQGRETQHDNKKNGNIPKTSTPQPISMIPNPHTLSRQCLPLFLHG